MRSAAKSAALTALLVACAPLAPAGAAAGPGTPAHTAPSATAIDSALAALRRDPNLGGQTRIRTLRWVTPSQPRPPQAAPGWMFGLFDFAGQFAGLLLWAAGAGAAALAVIWILRTLKSRAPRAALVEAAAGGRLVQDLDLHPDSLPGDVGAAALELLRAGRLREALSLLYRAALSSAVHRFGAAIGAHHTEREVLSAVRGALDEPRAAYFQDLVAIRQRVVYGGESLPPDAVLALCTGFSTCFAAPP